MKTFLSLTVAYALGCSLSAAASPSTEAALRFVPAGKVVEEKSNEVKVQTPTGSIVEVEFKKDGSFEEASGANLEKDLFVPPAGLLSLKEAVAAVRKAGKAPVGEWSLDESLLRGWRYEFEGVDGGKSVEYTVDAKTGALLGAAVDD